jgi:predicted transcriptional regulator
MAAKRRVKRRNDDPVADELDSIKRLLVLQLITSGVQAMDIAAALGVDKSVVSRLVPARKVKKRTATR